MAIPFDDDLTQMFSVDEHGTSISYRRVKGMGDSTILGIFDNETIPVDAGGFATVHDEQPRFTCRTSDVPYIASEDEMVISSVSYYVRAWEHDGTGVTVVHLEKQ